MGAWGHGIRQDDFVCDVIGSFEDLLKKGNSVADAEKAVRARFSAECADSDDGPLFWIALADMQWTYGKLEPQILDRVKDDLGSGRSLAAWDQDQRGLAGRRTALEKFIGKLSTPNPRPKKPPKLVIRKPKFRAGDCLSIYLSNKEYGAALVLVADHSDVEYGKNLIGVLDYLSPQKPPIEVFQERKWLLRNRKGEIEYAWFFPLRFRAAKERLEVIGQVELRESDPKDCNIYRSWDFIGEQVIVQRERDREAT